MKQRIRPGLAVVLALLPALLAVGCVSRLLPAGADSSGGMSASDGYIALPGLDVRDDDLDDEPATAHLDPDLLAAVRAAARDAAADGVRLRITSGWRSKAYQQKLLDRATAEHGSRAEALRWVKTPGESTHVTGHAVDVGPTDAAYWLARHGPAYGLCQVYANEIWHYELLTRPGGRCPPMHPDSATPS